jgi:hypothetical protein
MLLEGATSQDRGDDNAHDAKIFSSRGKGQPGVQRRFAGKSDGTDHVGVSEGRRGGMLFFDLAEPSQVVETVEPFFLNLNAAVELIPVMNGDDLRKGLAKASQK